ncbi:MAG TPA: hypothetical protein VFJ98_08545 [Mycobacteriales bacterium]|nr:hypothetical protein [Mycobacteriales bacterium]
MLRSRSKARSAVEDTVAPEVYPQEAGADAHALHAVDATCARCNQTLTERDEVRRRASGDYVHICC